MSMEFARILQELQACTELLPLVRLAKMFRTSKTTVRSWRSAYGFPEPVSLTKETLRTHKRYWRPDQVADWVRERDRIESVGLDVDAVCRIVGMHPDTWFNWVKLGNAPAHRFVALGTGHHLWDRSEVHDWLNERTGGYSLPSDYRSPPAASKPRGRRRKLEGKEESRA